MAPSSLMEKRNEIIGVICFAVGLFLALCLLSYHPNDPSFTRFAPDSQTVRNLVGSFGSHTADSLIRLIGVSAFWFSIFSFVAAYRFFSDQEFRIGFIGLIGLTGIIVSTSGLSAVAIGELSLYGIRLSSGGLLGSAITDFLNGYFNPIGTYLLLVCLLIVSLMILIDLSLVSMGRKVTTMAGKSGTASGLFLLRLKDLFRRKSRDGFPEATGAMEPVIDDIPSLPRKARQKKAEQTQQQQIHFDFYTESSPFTLPPLSLLNQIERKDTRMKRESLIANSRILEKKLSDFGVEGKVVEVRPGPVITMYELEPAPGVKINKITNLSDDLALALKAPSIRIIAPIPGKAVIGIEIPNHEREPVHLKDVLDNETFRESQIRLPIALGEDIIGAPVITDLIRMPHLLIAGTTGSGKSVGLNAMICSILFKAPPDDVKFLLIDPKRLELSAYEGIPHLLHPVVVDPKKAAQVLKWAVIEMERRYEIISRTGVKSIEAYNKFMAKNQSGKTKLAAEEKVKITDMPSGEREMPNDMVFESVEYEANKGKLPPDSEMEFPVKLPYIVIVIDELADLMMVAQRNVEESLARIAQMARAAGIHLILATQRPSVDVITGVIKANFPTRISFQVSSKVDSRTILDQLGAEKLLGAGDMLFIPPGASKLTRIHGAYVTEKEIDRVVTFLKKQGKPAYDKSIEEYEPEAAEGEKEAGDFDEKYDEAVELVTDLGHASISLVQRYMKIGYNRAARIIERMEAEGVVGPSDGVKPRKVLARKIPH
ncbi:MAG: DNA translocase FtsK 4TM domain-containing protein [Deltaproteobacteria bacterium]|nr:DNA translocase FtsK 4TM domain-containing protein [Deltaproteobacteria bacterium]